MSQSYRSFPSLFRAWSRLSGAWVVPALLLTGCATPSSPPTQPFSEGATSTLAQALTSAPAIGGYAALAGTSIAVDQNGLIDGGHAGVVTVNGTPLLTAGYELAVQENGRIDPSKLVIADSVKLDNNSTVGDVGTNGLSSASNATHGAVSAFATPPSLPSLLPVTAGSTAVTVNNNQTTTLAPGAYGAVVVKNNATLKLSGGTYHFASLVVNQNARVELLTPGEVRIAGRVEVQQNGFFGPTWSGATAKDLVIHIHGADSGSSTWAFSAIQNALVRGLVLAPNGTADVYQNGTVQGAVAAKLIHVRQNGKITWEDGFTGASCAGSCDDANPCTTDACVSGVCTHTNVAAGASCSDGNACNGAETCNASGSCQAGTAPVVDDGNPCTTDSCQPATGVTHTPVSAGTACSDGNACNGAETCNAAGSCVAGTPPTLDDGNPCTVDACSPSGGVTHTPVAVGTSCSLCGATCNAGGTCVAGTINVDDGNPCTADACNPSTGVTHTPVSAGTSCDDGNACNGAETCNGSGTCQTGTAPTVDDGNPCTVDACSPSGGVTHTPASAGTACSDGNVCNGAETCNGGGACVAGVALVVDDGNPCTIDACSPSSGVTNTPTSAGTACSDGNVCNGAETCNGAGSCVAGAPLVVDDGNVCTADACDPITGVSHASLASGTACSDGNACNGVETCDGAGHCQAGTAPSVDDQNPCTADACDPAGGVVHTFVSEGTSCSACGATCNATGTCVAGTVNVDDANPCTADACDPVTGVSHTPLSAGTACSDGDACNGAETCSAAAQCEAGTAPTVDDGNPCTVDSCDAIAGVQHTPAVVGTTCSDGDACNGAETCNGTGACVAGVAPTVDDGNPCTIDACSAVGGVTHTPASAGTACSDGNACNGAETCDGAGACVAGTALVVDDGNPCTTDACNAGTGVSHTPVAVGTVCADSDACNGVETCNAAGTCVAGTAPVVDDGNPCTTDSCDASTGVMHVALAAGSSCSDGNACNGAETCSAAASCQPGTAPVVDDGNPCTTDSCDPSSGVAHVAVSAGTSCSDGNACNGAESCDGSGACQAGTAPLVDDGNPCTADACAPATGVSHTPLASGTSCADADVCNGAETCNGAGACVAGTALVVDDGNPCTTDSCHPVTGVVHAAVAVGVSCSDGDACNGTETCNGSGTCASGTAPTVDDGNPCTSDVCVAATGVAHTPLPAGTVCGPTDICDGHGVCGTACPLGCDDGNPCTTDACTTGGCTHTAKAAGTSCADSDLCNGAEVCNATGGCVAGTPLTVDDGNPCTADACAPATGVSHTPLSSGTSCSDGNACNGLETCNATGSCIAGTALTVDDGNPCTADSCVPATGVVHTPVSAGTSCADATVCNGAETCDGAGTCVAGTALSVDDGNPCTVDACDPVTGVSHTNAANGTSCSGASLCFGSYACQAGSCVGSSPVTCTAQDDCHTAGVCNPTTGACSNPAKADGAACNDGNACTSNDACQAGACAGTAIVCVASDACHMAGTCSPTTGLCDNPTRPECAGGLPPDPCWGAAALDPTVPTSITEQVKSLWGPVPVQTSFNPNVLTDKRIAPIHGRIVADDGSPVTGARVTVVLHPEYGQTLSRFDGAYDLAVNGGPMLALRFEKSGYLPVERSFLSPWSDFVNLDDIVMVAESPSVSTVQFGSASCQSARSLVETDIDGTRRSTIVINPNTHANLRAPNGSLTALSTGSVRMTEYSVGTEGVRRLPATLPVESAYAYAVQLSVDEAANAGATLELDQPVVHYVENFVDLPVGTEVPAASYERCSNCLEEQKGWVATGNGRVIKILSVTAGTASIDANGDNNPDMPAELADLGISACELSQLGALYAPGTTLLRNPMPRAGAWSLSPGYANVPDDSVVHRKWPETDLSDGCIEEHGNVAIDVLNRRVRTKDAITGTPYSLVCSTGRADALKSEKTLVLWDERPLGKLKRIEVYTTRGGLTTKEVFAAAPLLRKTISWDGKDACGRPTRGNQQVTVRIAYVYSAEYGEVPRFALTDATSTGTPTRAERTVWRTETFDADRPTAPTAPGCDFDVHHVYDKRGTIQKGDGSLVLGKAIGPVINRLTSASYPAAHPLYSGSNPLWYCGLPAKEVAFDQASNVTAADDGSMYFIQRGAVVVRIKGDGMLQCVAGTGVAGYGGDGGPATSAQISAGTFTRVLPAPNCDGCFYIADADNHRVRYVDAAGIIQTVVGTGVPHYSPNVATAGAGDLATASQIYIPWGLALGHDGSLYVGTRSFIGRVLPDGRFFRVASNFAGTFDLLTTPINARSVDLGSVSDISVGPDGRLLLVDSPISTPFDSAARQMSIDGQLYRRAGRGARLAGEGLSAFDSYFYQLWGMRADRQGKLHLTSTEASTATQYGGLVNAVDDEGKVRIAAGAEIASSVYSDGGPAAYSPLPIHLFPVDLAPDGSIYVADGGYVARTTPALRQDGTGPFLVGAADGREVYEFDGKGRHVVTRDALTRAVRQSFTYDTAGRLSTVTDIAGQITTLQRDGLGRMTAIVAPQGQRTELGVDADGLITSVRNPANETVGLGYIAGTGLIGQRTEPDGTASSFVYDEKGLLLDYREPGEGGVTFSGASEQGSRSVSRVSSLGLSTTLTVDYTDPTRETRAKRLPDGTTATQVRQGIHVTTTQETGLSLSVDAKADPRFGMAAPFATRARSTDTEGLTSSRVVARTVTLSNATDPYSVVKLNDVTNGGPTIEYTAADREFVRYLGNHQERLRLDTRGRLFEIESSPRLPTAFNYDTAGRPSTVVRGDRTITFAYGADGLLSQQTDALAKVTTYTRDAAGRVTSETQPDSAVVTFGYDARGRAISSTRAGHAPVSLSYSPRSEVLAVQHGAGGNDWSYDYDQDGRLTSFTTAAATATLSYDAGGRLASVAGPAATATVARTSETETTATTGAGVGLRVQTNGLFPTEITTSGEVASSIELRRATGTKVTTESLFGSNVSYAFSDDGLVNTAGEMTFSWSVQWDIPTRLTLRGETESKDFDSYGQRLSRFLSTSDGQFYDSVVRDKNGRITSNDVSTMSTIVSRVFSYDDAGRVKTFDDGTTSQLAVYDAAGNRSSLRTNGVTVPATFDGHDRLLSQGTTTYTYDGAGNVATKTTPGGVTTYSYSVFGELTRVALPNGHVVDYVLDPLGRRVGKKVDGTLVAGWVYRDTHRLLAELDGTGAMQVRYVYADGDAVTPTVEEALRVRAGLASDEILPATKMAPVYVLQGQTLYRVLTDGVGSVLGAVQTTSASNSHFSHMVSYDPWGRVLTETGTPRLALGFHAGITDRDTGLVHIGRRDYDPETGRFTTPTRDVAPLKRNRYEFAHGDPVNEGGLGAPTAGPLAHARLDSLCTVGQAGVVSCGGGLERKFYDLPTLPNSGRSDGDLDLVVASNPIDLMGGSAVKNNPPVMTAGQDFTTVQPAANVLLHGSVVDDGLVQPLDIEWRVVSQVTPGYAPGDTPFPGMNPLVTFEDVHKPDTRVSFPWEGTYVLALKANDGEFTREESVTVTVVTAVPGNGVVTGAMLTMTGPSTVDATHPARYTATATRDGVPIADATYDWRYVSGPAGFSVTPVSASYQTVDINFTTPGTYELSVRYGTGNDLRLVTKIVEVTEINLPPTVNAGPDRIGSIGDNSLGSGSAVSDDNRPHTSSLTTEWTQVGGPVVAPITFYNSLNITANLTLPGAYTFRLTAFDGELYAWDDKVITVPNPTTLPVGVPGGTPVVTISGITDDQVVTKPVTVSGTITAGTWALQVRPGGRDDNEDPYTTIASGAAPTAGVLGTFDPTQLVNGVYTVRVVATTDTATTEESVGVAVDGNMKIGMFTVSFNDMEVNLGRLPITINRTYDSRQAAVRGDFGFGWRLSTSDVRVTKTGVMGKWWQHTVDTSSFFPVYCLVPRKASTVTFTLPGGKQYRFQPQASPQCQQTLPVEFPDIAWVSTSHPGNPTVSLSAEGQTGLIAPTAGGLTELTTASSEPWDPKAFTLTLEDGTKLDLELGRGLTRLEDRVGNAYTIDANGIHHSAGEDILFKRDGQGKIVEISDPAGKSLKYSYGPTGDLDRVEERTGAATTFAYASNPKHFLTDYKDQRGVQTVRNTYAADGRLIATTDAKGNTIQFTHDVGSKREVVRDRLGNATTYEYDDRGNVVKTTNALGETKLATYDVYDNTLSETDGLGRTTTYTYDPAFNRTSTTNAMGQTQSSTFDSWGQVLTSTNELGQTTTNTYFTEGLRESVDPLGHRITNDYNARGERIGSKDARGFTTLYGYNRKHQLVRSMDPLGHQVLMAYDANGRETARYESKVPAPFGQNLAPTPNISGGVRFGDPSLVDVSALWTMDDALPAPHDHYEYLWEIVSGPTTATFVGPYGPTDGITTLKLVTPGTYTVRLSVSDTQLTGTTEATFQWPGVQYLYGTPPALPADSPDMQITRTEYDANGRVVKVTNPDGSTTSTEYDAAGQVTARVDGLGRRTTMTYDALGRHVKTTNPDGTTTATVYDVEGRATARVNEAGQATVTTYDAVGRAVKVTYADGSSTQTAYDAAGQRVSLIDERGFVTTYGYDAAGRMKTVTDPLGHATTSVFDAAGRTVGRIDALGHATTTVYDAAGRTTSMTDAMGATTTYEYDAAGMKTAEVDALGRRQEWAYDDVGRLVEAKDQGGNAWVYGYDAVGNHTTQTDALGRVTRFEYDEMQRQVARVLPMGQRETFAYDAAGNRVAKTDFNGFTTQFGYDLRNRMVAKVPDPARGEATVAMSYSPTGRKLTASNGSGLVRYAYDDRERMVKKEMPAGTLSYTYDASGHVATMKSSNVGGVDVSYAWDGVGRLTSVTDPAGASTFEYDAAGRMTKRTDPNGVVMTYAYDSANRVLDVMAKRGGTAFADYAYQRDVIGRVTNLTELSGRVVTYGYSTAGRLVNETISGEPHGINGAISYTHDAVGNRLTRTSTVGPVSGQTFAYDANDRIAAEMYDANGNTLASDGDVFQYDFEDRLTAINGGVAISYDAGGNIGSRTEGGTKVSYLVDERSPTGYTQVVEEVTAGSVGKTFTYGQMALRTGGKTYVQDGHTDVRALASSSGVVTDEYDYEAFGVGTRTSGSSSNPLRYTGERAESAGLTFLRARHMRNGSGRFVGMDPWMGSNRTPSSLNDYHYGSQNPVGYRDRTGMFSMAEVSAISSIVGNLASAASPSDGGFSRSFGGPFIELAAVADEPGLGYSQAVLGATATKKFNEVRFTNANSLVDEVHKRAGGMRRVSELTIFAHGFYKPAGDMGTSSDPIEYWDNYAGIAFGSDMVTDLNFSYYAPTLRELTLSLAPGATVHLNSCETGRSARLLSAFSGLWGVPVYGFTGLYNPIYGFTTGVEVCSDGPNWGPAK